jgi:hypothetical protein
MRVELLFENWYPNSEWGQNMATMGKMQSNGFKNIGAACEQLERRENITSG